jgi:hypothetical protein
MIPLQITKCDLNCCDELRRNIEENELPTIGYFNWYREYYIRRNESSVHIMNYCPWCGKKFTESLRDVYFEILRENYGHWILPTYSKIAKEFKSDEWWKKRDL